MWVGCGGGVVLWGQGKGFEGVEYRVCASWW